MAEKKSRNKGSEVDPRRKDDAGSAAWVLVGKLEPPQQRVAASIRERLLSRLNSALGLPLTVLISPPGFGKTTLLCQWHQALRERGDVMVAWLSVDEDDGEVSRFVVYLALAIARAGVALGPLVHDPRSQLHDIDARDAVTVLIAAIRELPRKLVLVLDDYDRTCSRAVDEVVERLIRHGGGNLHVLLSSRTHPSLPLSDLAVRGLVERIEAKDLALSMDEAHVVLGSGITEEAVRQLHERTEGWAVALQLASLWLSGGGLHGGEMGRFSGRSVEIAAYLAEQVVQGLEPSLRNFLLETSILDRFDVHLANAVRQRSDSGAQLARLTHFEGLLIPLDAEHEWHRYHHLFADFLRQQLRHGNADLEAPLHRRAAEWFSVHGDLLEAVKHAIKAGAPELAISYVATAGGWELVLWHGLGYVRPLLRHFDPRVVRETPVLNITQTYMHIRLGEFPQAQGMLERFRSLPDDATQPYLRDYTVMAALLRHYLDQFYDNHPSIVALAAQAETYDADDFLARGTIYCVCATSELGWGDFAAAEDYSTRGLEDMRQASNLIGATYALIHRGQSYYYRGMLTKAEMTYREGLAIAEHYFGIESALKAVVSCLLAQLLCQRGQFDEARSYLETGIEFIETRDGWLDIFAAAYEAALTVKRADSRTPTDALSLLAHVEQIAEVRHLERLGELVMAWRLDVMLNAPDVLDADLLVHKSDAEFYLEHILGRAGCWRQEMAMGLALAHWHQLAGRNGPAMSLLRTLETSCTTGRRALDLARVRARMALVLQYQGDNEAALAALGQVLDYVEAEGASQVILQLGLPVKSLLRLAMQQDTKAAAGSNRCLLIQHLLDEAQQNEEGADDLLSGREVEVLRELCRGHSNKQIGRMLNLSENTVKFHLKSVFRKLNVETRGAAVAAAIQRGVAPAQDRALLREGA